MSPKRIQRSRSKGWRMPPNAVYVGRGSLWGNPFVAGQPSGYQFNDGGDPTPLIAALSEDDVIEFYSDLINGFIRPEMHPWGHAWLKKFKAKIRGHSAEWARASLKGKDLACWCALDRRCHADVLLRIANFKCISA